MASASLLTICTLIFALNVANACPYQSRGRATYAPGYSGYAGDCSAGPIVLPASGPGYYPQYPPPMPPPIIIEEDDNKLSKILPYLLIFLC